MKKSVWISMIVAAALVLAGIACIAVGHALGGHTFLTQGDEYMGKTVQITHHEDRDFDRIRIDVLSADVELIPSEDDKCRVMIKDHEKVEYTVRVVEDTLTVHATDKRAWYQHLLGGLPADSSVKIALPKEAFKSLYVNTTSGDVNLNVRYTFSEDVTLTSNSGTIGTAASVDGHLELHDASGDIFAMGFLNTVTARTVSGDISLGGTTVDGGCTTSDVKLKSTSGDIAVRKATLNGLTVDVGSGDIALDSLTVTDAIHANNVSGDVLLLHVTCGELDVEATSCSVELIDSTVAGHLSIKTGSGDVHLERADAETLYVKTVSGFVKGSLRTPKVFYADTSSGSVDVPKSTEGGLCEIKTTSGDIRIIVEE